LPTITADQLLRLLGRYVDQTGATVDLLLVGALALQVYGYPDRATQDIDAEVSGPIDLLLQFLTAQHIPADLTQNFSGWSVVAMPPGYRERATDLIHRPNLRVRLLSPVDFIIAKLRRGTDLDCEDALLVAHRFAVSSAVIQDAAAAAIAASPQDTALFVFRKTVDRFCSMLHRPPD
jgi:hypothetical protein